MDLSLRPQFAKIMEPLMLGQKGTDPCLPSVGARALEREGEWFEVFLDVNHFTSGELSVETTGDFIVVHGKHGEAHDGHGFCCREFTRRYRIPDDVSPRLISSVRQENGILVIQAPKKIVRANDRKSIDVPLNLQKTYENECSADNKLSELQISEAGVSDPPSDSPTRKRPRPSDSPLNGTPNIEEMLADLLRSTQSSGSPMSD